MSARFAEIDRRQTPIGEISVRRRVEPTLQVDVYEVKLDDEFLMSTLFTVAEEELARLSLAELDGTDLQVVVGGLGLGFTARAALEDPRVSSLRVVEALGAVIEWHDQHLLPGAEELTADPRCQFVEGDFFAMVAEGAPFGPGAETLDAILVDIDHTPRHLLDSGNASFYTEEGLTRLAGRLRPGGVFGLWSDDPPDDDFLAVARSVFVSCEGHVVTFPNFYTGESAANTVYVAKTADPET